MIPTRWVLYEEYYLKLQKRPYMCVRDQCFLMTQILKPVGTKVSEPVLWLQWEETDLRIVR